MNYDREWLGNWTYKVGLTLIFLNLTRKAFGAPLATLGFIAICGFYLIILGLLAHLVLGDG